MKPENVLIHAIDGGEPDWKIVHVTNLILKLSDFGLSLTPTQSRRVSSQTVMLKPQKSFPCMAPEIKRAFLDCERAPFSKCADIWACGILALCMFTGETSGTVLKS